MLDYSIMKPEGILVLKPHVPPKRENSGGFTAHMHFVREHYKQIDTEDVKALDWLETA